MKASTKECMTVTSKVRIYDLAKELKLDTKRLIEEVRREGVDVSVPSNSVSKELAEKIRTKYFPKKEATAKRVVKVVKKAARPVNEEALEAAEMDTAEALEAHSPSSAEATQIAEPAATATARQAETKASAVLSSPSRQVRVMRP